MPFPSRVDPSALGSNALAVVERSGWDSWSLREVAAAVGVAPNALYRYVDGRQGLHVAIGAAAARELLARLEQVPVESSPLDDAIALSCAYVSFGTERPHAYMAFMTAKPNPDHASIVEWTNLWVSFQKRIAPNAPAAADALSLSLWALLHGRIDLARTAARYARADAGLEHSVRALVAGYKAGGPATSPLPEFLISHRNSSVSSPWAAQNAPTATVARST